MSGTKLNSKVTSDKPFDVKTLMEEKNYDTEQKRRHILIYKILSLIRPDLKVLDVDKDVEKIEQRKTILEYLDYLIDEEFIKTDFIERKKRRNFIIKLNQDRTQNKSPLLIRKLDDEETKALNDAIKKYLQEDDENTNNNKTRRTNNNKASTECVGCVVAGGKTKRRRRKRRTKAI